MTDLEATYQRLKQRQRAERGGYSDQLGLRVHRALSWLNRASQDADPDGQFIFLWIAFNAAYATEIDNRQSLTEQDTFNAFLRKLWQLDTDKRLGSLVWQVYPGAIRVLLDNPYVFPAFWAFHNGRLTEEQWQRSFAGAKQVANAALARQDTPTVLSVVFDRIYTLRNQLIHGGATWNSSVNRNQMRDCVAILSALVPVVVETMMDNPQTLWGDASFPVVK